MMWQILFNCKKAHPALARERAHLPPKNGKKAGNIRVGNYMEKHIF